MRSLSYIFLFSIVTALFSCDRYKSDYFTSISTTNNGTDRTTTIGTSIEEIRSHETDSFLIDNMPDYLHYDYPLSMGNSYTVTYDFADNKLYEVEIASYFDAIDDAERLFKDFTLYFDKNYGKGKVEEDGYTSWKVKDNKGNYNTEIVMINDSKSYGYTFIRIRDLGY